MHLREWKLKVDLRKGWKSNNSQRAGSGVIIPATRLRIIFHWKPYDKMLGLHIQMSEPALHMNRQERFSVFKTQMHLVNNIMNVSFCKWNAGKTTVTQAVKDALNGILLRSPPACISHWRTVFDDEQTPIKRAFYAAGNYILASEIAKASTQAPVIIDRFVCLRSPLISVPSYSCSVLQAVSDGLCVSSVVLFWGIL